MAEPARDRVNILDVVARSNPAYVDALYREYRRDPSAVDEEWRLLFAGYELGAATAPAWSTGVGGVADLVHSYRELGHLCADLDPLGRSPRCHPLLDLPEFGLGDADLDTIVDAAPFRGLGRVALRELVAALEATYCGTLGVEYFAVSDKNRRAWLQQRMEPTRNRPALTPSERRETLERLVAAETFEHFLGTRYVGQKRFSLEGAEALIPLLDTLVEDAAADGVEQLVLGMPHRGRLNVLAHVLRKPYALLLAEFEGAPLPDDAQGDGDVKYHLGYSHDHPTRSGRTIHLSLPPNPSHLEAVDPVVEGLVRGKQRLLGDAARKRVVPVLLHGDASFTGQGIVYETLALGPLRGFTTGGTVHVIVDNQIGFTTSPEDYRFAHYPSALATVLEAPVFHVNGDDPEACVQAARLALGYRQAFGGDVFIHVVCYRRHGHNELDDPTFTQPEMYATIHAHPTVVTRYAERLRAEGVVDDAMVAQAREAARRRLDEALAVARAERPRQPVLAFGGAWAGLGWAGDDWSAATAVEATRLREVADALVRVPDGFHPHPRLTKLLEERRERVHRGEAIDWGTAEALALGSLLLEGVPVRLSGQDTIRGTFSHRHAVLYDAEGGRAWAPLAHLAAGQADIEVVNSPLSEAAVLGFEYGVSSADPRRLVAWEAQFGDFVDGAQVIVDAFIASGESKWQRMSGLTLLLPHGYEGQGPEHSSARLERFLQLCAERNLQVVNATTPAQYFHVLRRQMHRRFRKPLVVMSPKSLLRHPRAVSRLEAFTQGGFQTVLDDPRVPDAEEVRRVLFCSGRIFYTLDHGREQRKREDVRLVRVEQLYPFPASEIAAVLRRAPRVTDACWVQEEPANQGAWSFVAPRLADLLPRGVRLRYIGREEAASPAAGIYAVHQAEEEAILEQALKPAAA